jgi:hypothetical protein
MQSETLQEVKTSRVKVAMSHHGAELSVVARKLRNGSGAKTKR